MSRFLSGKKIYLRGLNEGDCRGRYLFMANDVENLSFVEGLGYWPASSVDLKKYVKANNKSSDLLLGIFENTTDLHVGNIRLSRIKPYHHTCMLGIIIHKDYIGKGYALESSRLLIKHAFEVLNMHRIQISVVDKNTRAIKLYKKLGAIKEGSLREAFYFNNKYYHVLIFSILKKEYFKARPSING